MPEAFITEVNVPKRSSGNKKDVVPLRIRQDNQKLTEVVDAFRSKVDLMVTRQREEYEEAYEHHMEGIQKELHFLREKAKEISDEATKDEKLHQLHDDQVFYSNEAIRLDAEANELRKKLRSLAGTLHNAERERDWLLDKLKNAKGEYKKLSSTRLRIMEKYDSIGGSFASDESSAYTLEILKNNNDNNNGINMGAPQRGGQLSPIKTTDTGLRKEPLDGMSKLQLKLEKDLHRSKTQLVQLKTKQEHLFKFMTECEEAVRDGYWDKYFRNDSEAFTESMATFENKIDVKEAVILEKRPLQEVLDDCSKAVAVEDQEGADILRSMLAVELALIPETFEVIMANLLPNPMQTNNNNTNIDGGGNFAEDGGLNPLDAAAMENGIMDNVIGPDAAVIAADMQMSIQRDVETVIGEGSMVDGNNVNVAIDGVTTTEGQAQLQATELMDAAEQEWDQIKEQQNNQQEEENTGYLIDNDISSYLRASSEHRLRLEVRRQEEAEAEAEAREMEMIELHNGAETVQVGRIGALNTTQSAPNLRNTH